MLHRDIFEWAASGRLNPADAPRAFSLAGLSPRRKDWRSFLEAMLLWIGMILVVSGVIFFFAYNWQTLDRFLKFALAEAVFVVALVAAWYFGPDRLEGQVALCGVSLLTGALLALVGQTYQTGADTFELFMYWAVLMLPWVVVARFAPLWLLWIALINVAFSTYSLAQVWGLMGLMFGVALIHWILFGVNLIALAVWELGLAQGIPSLNRWGARALGLISGSLATIIGILSIVDANEIGGWVFFVYAAWCVGMYFVYRRKIFDVFMLSGLALSVVVIVATFLSRELFRHSTASGFLFTGLIIIGMSGAAGWWIRRLLKEQP